MAVRRRTPRGTIVGVTLFREPGTAGPAGPALRRAALPLAVLGAAAGALGYVAAVDPNSPSHYPVCPLLHYTGVYCPGCGGLRSAYAVTHGHLGTALGCNAVAVAGYALCAVLWLVWFGRAVRARPFAPSLPPSWVRAAGVLLLAFTVVRNLPFGAALAP